jgi:hypothetical protein
MWPLSGTSLTWQIFGQAYSQTVTSSYMGDVASFFGCFLLGRMYVGLNAVLIWHRCA